MNDEGLLVTAAWFSDGGKERHQVESRKLMVTVKRGDHVEQCDRYDAVLLLETRPDDVVSGPSRLDGPQALDTARFHDLREKQREETLRRRAALEQLVEEQLRKRQKVEDEREAAEAAAASVKEDAFECPYDVPEGLKIPASEKQHQVIWTLVQFVHSKGEAVVQQVAAKQQGNPLFSFVSDEDALHPYFQFLLDGLRNQSLKPPPHVRFFQEIPRLGGGALVSLLGSDQTIKQTVIDIFVKYCSQYPHCKAKILAAIPSDDERFDFVSPSHELNAYYLEKIAQQEKPQEKAAPKKPDEEAKEERKKRALQLMMAEGFL